MRQVKHVVGLNCNNIRYMTHLNVPVLKTVVL